MTRTDESTDSRVWSTTQRRYYVTGLFLVIIGFALAVGYMISINSPQRTDVQLFGIVTVPFNPIWMMGYTTTVAILTLAAIFGIVTTLSKYDDSKR